MPTPPSNLSHHIVACIFSEDDSPLIGLGSFIMPLRASNFHYSELKYVILLGNIEYIRREWTSIKNFPKILVMPVSTALSMCLLIKLGRMIHKIDSNTCSSVVSSL